MKLSHVAYHVKNMDLMISFYKNFFEAEVIKRSTNPITKLEVCFLFHNGIVMEFLYKPENLLVNKEFSVNHIAFRSTDIKELKDIFAKANAFMLDDITNIRETTLGDVVFTFKDIEGNLIEIILHSEDK